MHVQNDTQRIAFGDWTLRIRPASEGTPRIMLMIHGWTGNEDSMWIFTRNLARDFWLIAPRAPYAGQPSGFSWRPALRGSRAGPGFEDLRPAADALIRLVEDYAARNQIQAPPFDVMGFSQGAALTTTLALLYPDHIRRAGVLSGFFPPGAESLIEHQPLKGKRFFVAHGTLDEMVRIEVARESVQMLERAGATVTFCEDEVGHKVSTNCMRSLELFFA